MMSTEVHPTGCSCCFSNEDGTIWICGRDQERSDWFSTVRKWRSLKDKKVYVGCCNRLALAEETQSQFYSTFDGYVAGYRHRCRANRGCNINPGYKRTAHLRYYEFDE